MVDQSDPDSCFPSQSNEKHGHWVGFAKEKGDQFTWKILTDDTQKVLIESSVCSATQSALQLTSNWMGTDKRLTSLPILLYMVLPHLKKILSSCPPSILTTYWGEPFFFLLKRMGSAIEPALFHMSTILKIPKLHEKISCTYT